MGNQNRDSLQEIQKRHGWDRWKDVTFISAALLLTALAIGSLGGGGRWGASGPSKPKGHLEVVYSGQIEFQK